MVDTPTPMPTALIPGHDTRHLPPLVLQEIESFSEVQKATFAQLYEQQAKRSETMVLLAVFFPIQFILLKKVGLWVAFLFTGGGLGIWWIVEWFMTPGRVRAFNSQVAMDIAGQVKAMSRA